MKKDVGIIPLINGCILDMDNAEFCDITQIAPIRPIFSSVIKKNDSLPGKACDMQSDRSVTL